MHGERASTLPSNPISLPGSRQQGAPEAFAGSTSDQQLWLRQAAVAPPVYVCHTAHMTTRNEIDAAFDFVTYNAARALRLEDYGLDPGCKADLNVLAAPSVPEVLRLQQPPGWVVRNGKILAHNQLQRELFNH